MSTQRIYRVTDDIGKTATMIRAGSQAQAINHVVRGVYKAAPATVEQVVSYMTDTKNAPIETAGAE